MFKRFKDELHTHSAKGYHRIERYPENTEVAFNNNYEVNHSYIEFIKIIGYGRFFDGSLIFFPFEGNGSVKTETSKIHNLGFKNFVSIGYDGTTMGYYCLKNDRTKRAVYWVDVQAKIVEKVAEDFNDWVEALPKELFNKRTYAAYKNIKDKESIIRIIQQRAKIEVEMLDYEKELVKPPDKKKDLLPRYNKIILSVKRNGDTPILKEVTIPFLRFGSSIGKDNIDYVTIDIDSLEKEEIKVIETYLFDPFNVPFEGIECLYKPEISLSSEMRAMFKEIQKYL